jgi:hypothetical protein
MKLLDARFCPDCFEVFSYKQLMSNDCPSCTNRQTVSIYNLFTKGFVLKDERVNVCGGNQKRKKMDI